MMLNTALYLALRVAAWLVPLLPERVAYALACSAGTLAYLLVPGPRRQISQNLARVMDLPPAAPAVRSAVRRAFQNDAKNWVDTLRISLLRPDQIAEAVQVEGWQHLEAALTGGRGAVIVALHLGNIDLVGQVVAAHGLKLTIPVERMQPERLFRFITERRTSQGLNVVPLERAPREMVQALKRNEIVAIVGDRNIAGKGVAVPFFGAPAVLSRSPVTLARHAGAPILLGYGVRLPDDRFRGYIHPVPVEWSKHPGQDTRVITARIAHLMEENIRRFPDQWLMFAPVWRSATTDAAVTIEQQPGTALS